MLLFSTVMLLLLEKVLKKHSMAFYCGAVLVSAAGYFAQTKLYPGMARTILSDYLTSGTLSAALFIIVMYAAVFPKKSRIFRCAMLLRGETAILASLLGLVHIVYYGHSMGKRAGAVQGKSAGEIITMTAALLLVLLLIPLTVTSFKRIRRKMNARRWKKLQRWSYLFYGLLYLHIAAALYSGAVSGDRKRLADFCCYTALFGIYTALRLGKYLEKKKKQELCPAVWALLVILLMAGSFGFSGRMVEQIKMEAAGTDDG